MISLLFGLYDTVIPCRVKISQTGLKIIDPVRTRCESSPFHDTGNKKKKYFHQAQHATKTKTDPRNEKRRRRSMTRISPHVVSHDRPPSNGSLLYNLIGVSVLLAVAATLLLLLVTTITTQRRASGLGDDSIEVEREKHESKKKKSWMANDAKRKKNRRGAKPRGRGEGGGGGGGGGGQVKGNEVGCRSKS
jgi:hypothetical protein